MLQRDVRIESKHSGQNLHRQKLEVEEEDGDEVEVEDKCAKQCVSQLELSYIKMFKSVLQNIYFDNHFILIHTPSCSTSETLIEIIPRD